jgi:ABC-type spermidine/putrescine transport system permease subunit I
MKSIMLFLVMLPLWTSLLVRNYAWMLLLERKGAINYFLLKLGIIDTPLRLIYNETGVIIGMVYIMLPFMILPLFGSVNSFDKMLLHAADSLGARPLQIFLFVYIPLTLPGIAAGSVLVFMLSLGFFITPAMLGGAREMMMAVRINEEAVHLLHWDVASALALILLIVTMLLFFVGMRWFGFRKIWEGLS